MPPIPDIDRPNYLVPSEFQALRISRPTIDPVSGEENEGTDDDHTLVEMMKNKKTKTSQEGANSPSGDLSPSHLNKPRITTLKRKVSISPGGDGDETSK
jgi:hypothetical protein